MARYKTIDTSARFLAVDLQAQLLPGTFEHALNHLIDNEIDLSGFDAKFHNDATGASAYPPAMLLKVVLLAYSRGIVSSRAIERTCREHVTFIALSGDTQPHFTTIAGFVSGLGQEIGRVFQQVLLICDRQGLIGREMFAIDGVKLPGNSSKYRSGTRAEFLHKARKMEAVVQTMLQRHREADQRSVEPGLADKQAKRIEQLQRDAQAIHQWLADHPEDRKGSRGKPRKSNLTDNDSAKMATSKGVIQGYTGVAAVDHKHQVIVNAQAHGTGCEHELLVPTVTAMKDQLEPGSVITADAGYHSGENLKALDELGVDALIADNAMRSRDERLAGQDKYKDVPDALHDKSGKKAGGKTANKLYGPEDFDFDAQAHTCLCPAGQRLYANGSDCTINGYRVIRFRGAQSDCVPCAHRDRCLRAYFSPSWTAFQADRGQHFSVIVDGVSD